MLILSRHKGESVLIGDAVVIEVLEIRHGTVRLGIVAPPEISVDRSEVRARPDYVPRYRGSSRGGPGQKQRRAGEGR